MMLCDSSSLRLGDEYSEEAKCLCGCKDSKLIMTHVIAGVIFQSPEYEIRCKK